MLCLLSAICGATVTRSSPGATTPAVALWEVRVGNFLVGLRRDTQTLARFSPLSEPGFSFVPLSHQGARSGDGYNHLGDLHLRVREGRGAWRDFDSSRTRREIRTLPNDGAILAAADITATMGANAPFRVERRWLNQGGKLALRFRIRNISARPLELGAVGMPMVFDNILTGRNLDDAHTHASFVDPYIGGDAGYLQVTRLNGGGPALLVLPEPGTPLEAYVPMAPAGEATASPFTDPTPRSVTFEGFFDWTVHSIGYAREWRAAGDQWIAPTGRTLAPGEAVEFGVRLAVAPDIRSIESTLIANRRPVVAGCPARRPDRHAVRQGAFRDHRRHQLPGGRAGVDPCGAAKRLGPVRGASEGMGTRTADDRLCRWPAPDGQLFPDQAAGHDRRRPRTVLADPPMVR